MIEYPSVSFPTITACPGKFFIKISPATHVSGPYGEEGTETVKPEEKAEKT